MEIIGYVAALAIGISLGLIGGGGSILAVPVMVYLFGVQPLLATSYSLFIVGSTSFVGAFSSFRKGLVSLKTALLFGSSSIVTVFVTRRLIIPLVPENILTLGSFVLTESILIMLLFAILMLFASISMIRSKKDNENEPPQSKQKIKLFKFILFGVGVGIVTGFLGAGGGFLLIPTLVLLVGLPMKEAIGTSLFIIALNSLIGFAGDIGHFSFDWFLLLKITAIATVGVFIGGRIGKKIEGDKLKKGFGWFVLVMGLYIILSQVFSP